MDSTNEAYNNTFAEEERVGRDRFVEVTKLLTKNGKSKKVCRRTRSVCNRAEAFLRGRRNEHHALPMQILISSEH